MRLLLFFIGFALTCCCLNVKAETNDNDSCAKYEKYANWVKQGSGSDEQKLMQLGRYMSDFYDEYAKGCDGFTDDKEEYQQRIFAYRQNHFLVTPSVVTECDAITDGDICDGERDWTGRAFPLLEFPGKTYRRPSPLESDILSIPYRKLYIPDMEDFISFADYQYKLIAVYYYYQTYQHNGARMQRVSMLPGVQQGDFMVLNEDKIKSEGRIKCDARDSCSWLSVIYKRDNFSFIKAVWYY